MVRIFVFLIFVGLCHAFNFKDGLYHLDKQNFNELFAYTKQKHGAMMIYFYSFNDNPRQSYLDEFQRAGKELHKDGDKVFLSKINVDTEPDLTSKYNAFETPKVVVLSAQEGMRYRYMKGINTKREIVKHARRVVPPGPKFFSNHTMFDHIFSEGHHLFVGFFEDLDGKEAQAFEKFARFMRYQNFAYTNNITMAVEFNLTKPTNGVSLFYKREMLTDYETKFIEYNDTSITLNAWGLQNYLLPVDVYDKYNHEFFNNKYRFKTMLCFDDIDLRMNNDNITNYRDYLNQALPEVENMTELALVSANHFKFLYSRLDPTHFAELVALKNGEWYKSLTPPMSENGTFRFDILKEFVENVYYDRIEPFVKSEPIPDEMYKNGITYLVGQNLESNIDAPGEEYLIMFTVAWNPRCEEFLHVMEDLANNEFKDVPGFNFVTIDSSLNWIPNRFKLHDMPTIYFVRDDYKPMRYIKEKSKEGIMKFLSDYSKLYQSKGETTDL